MDKFLIDEQTLIDIQLKESEVHSVYNFFEQTITEGGQYFFRKLFTSPQLDIHEIKDRQKKIKRLESVAREDFMFYRIVMKDLEKYIQSSHSGGTASRGFFSIFGSKGPIYFYKQRSISEICEFLINTRKFYLKIEPEQVHSDLQEIIKLTEACLNRIFKDGDYDTEKLKITIFTIERLDRLIRYDLAKDIKPLIQFFYEIDAYLAIAKIAVEHGFCYPEVFEKNATGQIHMEGLYHVFLKNPVKNTLTISQDKKLWFLTGANMAGKSSIIKAISSAIYLTHIGFPVPADCIKTDVLDGLFTSINLQDNLELGYSHFYVEALRLKTIISQLNKHSNALIILDELFKGTNHTDAYQAIFAVFKALAEINGPYVIISTHITELSEELKAFPLIDFYKMNIDTDADGLPEFTYKIKQGIAEERLGMWLLNKSGAFEALRKLGE